MSRTTRCLYDFVAEDESELSVAIDEQVRILENYQDGWVLAENSFGQSGLVPEDFLEKISNDYDDERQEYENFDQSPSHPPLLSSERRQQTLSMGEDDDDDDDFGEPPQKPQIATSMQNLSSVSNATPELFVEIDNVSRTCQWKSTEEAYSCQVGEGKKNSKFGGMKSFVEYSLTPSFSNIKVYRRYKHFNWLYKQLVNKFGHINVIPPIPTSQLLGNQEEELIERRRQGFQQFVNRICQHPVLSISSVWKHFITETDEKKWTIGKRKAEGDENVRLGILKTIQSTPTTEDMEEALDIEVAAFSIDIDKIEAAIKQHLAVANDQLKKFKNVHQKETRTVGKSLVEIGFAVKEERPIFVKIGMDFEAMSISQVQATDTQWTPVLDLLTEYKSIVAGWRQILDTFDDESNKIATGKKEIYPTLFTNYKIAINAERSYFRQLMNEEFSNLNKVFLEEKIKFNKQITEKLETLYKDCWPN